MGRTGGSRSPGELGTPSVDSPSQTKPLSPSSLAGLSGRQWHMDSINRLEARGLVYLLTSAGVALKDENLWSTVNVGTCW